MWAPKWVPVPRKANPAIVGPARCGRSGVAFWDEGYSRNARTIHGSQWYQTPARRSCRTPTAYSFAPGTSGRHTGRSQRLTNAVRSSPTRTNSHPRPMSSSRGP